MQWIRDKIFNAGRGIEGWNDHKELGGQLDYAKWLGEYTKKTTPQSSWRGNPIEIVVKFTKELKAKFDFNHVWGGKTDEAGKWIMAEDPVNQRSAREGWSLPNSNTAQNISDFDPPDGTQLRVRAGEANGLDGHEGGKIQIEILDPLKPEWFKNKRALTP